MSVEYILLAIASAGGFYMAWSIGANDVANAMGTSVGSGALTVKRAVILAAVLEFAGALFAGTHVSETIRKGIINPMIFQGHELDLVFGMIGALLSAAVWLQIASYFGWPVSTTHSIVGAVLGFGITYGGLNAVDWWKVGSIVASWVTSPLISGTIAFLLFTMVRRLIYFSNDPVGVAKRTTPYLVFLVFFVLTLAMVFKGLKNLHLDLDLGDAMLVATVVGSVASVVSVFLVRRIKSRQIKERILIRQPAPVGKAIKKALQRLERVQDQAHGETQSQLSTIVNDLRALEREVQIGTTVERIFVYLQILSAAFVAFAHGANDVANAVGPLAAVITVLTTGELAMKAAVPVWVLAMGGVGIIIGLATWGWRVMITIGKKITELTPTRGFCAEFATAATIVVATKFGIPVSTTHTLVGGVLGVGLARGISALNLKVVTNIIISWVVTIPIGAIGAVGIYYLMKAIFG
ncbi:MAG: inorganic phosphate transporter [Chlorobi bacterium]|nr:inorganic phosphate transporter [Chlorobiota bacterium]